MRAALTASVVIGLVSAFGLLPDEASADDLNPIVCKDLERTLLSGREEEMKVECDPWHVAGRTMRVTDPPDHGTMTFAPYPVVAGDVRYRSNPGFVGTDSFEVVADSDSQSESEPATVTLHVLENKPPVCDDINLQVTGDTGRIGFASRCSDPEGRVHPGDVEIVTPPEKGAFVPNLPSAFRLYAPHPGARGMDSFTYRARDGYLYSNVATVRITIQPPAPALPDRGIASQRKTFLLSRSYLGGLPDGPSRNGVVSHDARIARVMAFESDATDIVPGDANRKTDVFLIPRKPPWGRNGTTWAPGPTVLASTGLRGRPTDGSSYRPALDGDSHHSPRCLAFISEATNLVPGDRNGEPDAFLRSIATGQIIRVSLGARGRELRSATTRVSLDGRCERVGFVAGGRLFVRHLRADRTVSLKGRGGRLPNAPIEQATLARNGRSVVFSSQATNLDRLDRSPTSDIYRAAIGGRAIGRPRLVSRTREGASGDGPSTNPATDDFGRHIAFETKATNLISGDHNGASDILRAAVGKRPVLEWISRNGNGPSHSPSISGAGDFVLFESEATNFRQKLRSRDVNGVRDVFLWNRRTRNISRESRTADNGDLHADSETAVTSSRGNYVVFESLWPLIDASALDTSFPGWWADAAIYRGVTTLKGSSRARQVYVRYLGPK